MTRDKISEQERTRWVRLMEVFLTRDVASIGVVFDTDNIVEFHGKPVTSIAICQYIPNTVNGAIGGNSLAKIISDNVGKETCFKEPSGEMNGIFVWYGDGMTSQPEEVDGAFLPEILNMINDCAVSRYFIDKHYPT